MNTEYRNITWHQGDVSAADREALLKQKGCVVWFTGLSGSGKSTIAAAVEKALIHDGHFAYVLDGDNVRHGLNSDLGFTAEDRRENIRRIAEVSALFAQAGCITLTAFISPYREDRQAARSRLPAGRFLEVFVDTPLEVCEQRDPKTLYARARAGEISNFTGIDAPYEPPIDPELHLATADLSVEAAAKKVIMGLQERQLIR